MLYLPHIKQYVCKVDIGQNRMGLVWGKCLTSVGLYSKQWTTLALDYHIYIHHKHVYNLLTPVCMLA